jgi:hypothetical protein
MAFWIKIGLTLAVFLANVSNQLLATPQQVIIIRHGEKDAVGNLSQKGLERAGALAPYFAYTATLNLYGLPVALFAARPTPPYPPFGPDENTQRCIQTIGPTGELLKLPIHSGYDKFQNTQIATFILNDSTYSGKNLIICWHHEMIQVLAEAFGIVNPPAYPPNQYDQTWVITFNPAPSLTIYQQELLFGDTP